MAPHLDNARPVEHHDQIRHADRRKPVRYENRDATVLSRAESRTATAAYRSNSACSVSASSAAVGSSRIKQQCLVSHEPARQRQLLPLAEAHLDAIGPRRPELRVEAGGQARHDILRAGAVDGGHHRTLIVEPRHVAQPTVCPAVNSNRKNPGTRRRAACATRRRACAPTRRRRSRIATARRLVHFGEQLDERGLPRAVLADDRDDRAGGQIEIHVVEHEAIGARVCE